MIQRLILCCLSKRGEREGTAKASLKRANDPAMDPRHKIDPKPDELALARVNLGEIRGEARTG